MIAPEQPAAWLTSIQLNWYKISELISQAEYDQAAELLYAGQLESEGVGNHFPACFLTGARLVCLACSQCRAEETWHEQAHAIVSEREGELKSLLQAILRLTQPDDLTRTDASSTTAMGATNQMVLSRPPFEAALQSLWRRLQNLLDRNPPPQLVRPATSLGLITAPALNSTEKNFFPGYTVAAIKPDEARLALSSLHVYCLGTFRVYLNEQSIDKWPGHKAKSIFKYLINHRERPIQRDILIDLFWRDADPDTARRSLHQAIYLLRQTLQSPCPGFLHILSENGCYYFNPELEVWIDSEVFTAHYESGQIWERQGVMHEAIKEYEAANSLYEGEFLTEDIYEDWPLVQRENMKHAHLDILDRLSQYYFEQTQLATSIVFCQKLLAEDNCREDAHRRLMYCYLHQGQRHLALRQYHYCVEALKQELDVPPMPATVELYRCIQQNQNHF